MSEFASSEARSLCHELARLLVVERSLNEFLELAFSHIGEALGASRLALVDYYEQTDRFALLHFVGFGRDVHGFQEHLDDLHLRQALQTNQPFHPRQEENLLLIPLRFSDILEAVVVAEADQPLPLNATRLECGRVVSRLLGLLMSSSRLAVNRRFHFEGTDLRRAREIQLSFLPKQYPRTEEYEIYGINRSSSMVGGDYFDYFLQEQESLQAILADACGHGLAAALIMSNFRGLLQAQLAGNRDYSELFDRLNEAVHFEADFIQYLTGVFLDLDQNTGRLRYLNAGHFDPLVIGADGSNRRLPGGGPPLGMFKGSRYALAQAELSKGDILVLFTDGLVEIENQAAEPFGEERILAAVQSCSRAPLSEIAKRVLQRADEFAGEEGAQDDVTLLLLRLH